MEVARADSSHFPDEEPRKACRLQEMGEELRELGHAVSAQAAEALQRQWDGRAHFKSLCGPVSVHLFFITAPLWSL